MLEKKIAHALLNTRAGKRETSTKQFRTRGPNLDALKWRVLVGLVAALARITVAH